MPEGLGQRNPMAPIVTLLCKQHIVGTFPSLTSVAAPYYFQQ